MWLKKIIKKVFGKKSERDETVNDIVYDVIDDVIDDIVYEEIKETEKNEPLKDEKGVIMGLKINNLKGFIPEKVLEELPSVIERYEINTINRLSHFLSQCSHESGNFKFVEENLNYSSDGLKRVFPKYFPDNLSEQYSRQPEKIGSRVYANRMGNGNEESKEGYKFRGRGYIQCTGKDNYRLLSKEFEVDFIKDPDLLSKEYSLKSAGWFFKRNNLLSICDMGDTYEIVKRVTRVTNGGFNGLEDRWEKFQKFNNLLKK